MSALDDRGHTLVAEVDNVEDASGESHSISYDMYESPEPSSVAGTDLERVGYRPDYKKPMINESDVGGEGLEKKANNSHDPESAKQVTSLAMRNVDGTNIVSWDSPSDPANPLNWPFWLRWTLISLVSAMNFMAGLSSSMFAPGVPDLMIEFHSTNSALSTFVVTIFVLGLATGPLLFAPLSEIYGRLFVQHVGCIGFLIFSVACALSTSLNMLIGMRLLQGIFASVPLTNGGGVIADTVHQEERGFAMSMFTLGVLLGPVIGPVAGGFLAASKGWRWVFWVISMVLGLLSGACLLVWRESYAPILLARKASRLRAETGNNALRSKYDIGLSPRDHFKRGIGRAVKMLVYSPIVLALSVHMGLVYSYFYLLFTTLTPIFEKTYHFSPSTVGLSYLGVGIGFLVGQTIFARLGDRILMIMTAKSGNGEMKPEYRLPLCCVGGIFVPVGLFWYGWSVQEKVFWIVPIIGTGMIGLGNALIFISIQSYLVDAFTLYAASALAANTVIRSVMAAVLPLAAPKLYARLGIGWGNSLLAFLALAMLPVPLLLLRYGERMRNLNAARMKRL